MGETNDADLSALGSMTSLSGPLMQMFKQQMEQAGPQLAKAQEDRASALNRYKDAIEKRPEGLTGNDAFNAIGEGYYGNNWAWDPSTALAAGFKKMSEISAARRQLAMDTPILSSQVDYEDKKDLSDKMMQRQTLTPNGLAGLLAQDLRTEGAFDRSVMQQQAAVFKQAYAEALKTAKDPAQAVMIAAEATNEALARQGVPGLSMARLRQLVPGLTERRVPSAGLPGDNTNPQTQKTGPLDGLPVDFLRKIMQDAVMNPSSDGMIKLNIDPTTVGGKGSIVDQMFSPQEIMRAIAMRGAQSPAPKIVNPNPGAGESVEQRAARVKSEERAKAEGTAAGGEGTKLGLSYRDDILKAQADAIEANRSLNQIDKELSEFSKPGKLGSLRKVIAQWKVALGSKDEADIRDAAAAEEADKLTFDLATKSIRAFTPRGTQMELMRMAENNPNLLMTAKGREQMINFLRTRNNDAIEQAADFARWAAENDAKDEGKASSWLQHKALWNENLNKRMEKRYSAPQENVYKRKDGTTFKAKPYYSEKYKRMVVSDGKNIYPAE